tara:strand:- start:330 stop:617 length:288 start_codon:yes stop_codon:yes gene_type:complete
MKIYLKIASLLLVFCIAPLWSPQLISANDFFLVNNSYHSSAEEYLDFSYINFVIQLIIGGAAGSVIVLIGYHAKIMNFFSGLNKRKNRKKKDDVE